MKKVLIVSLSILLLAGAFAIAVSASDNPVPVNNAEYNAQDEIGPGVNCDICDGEPRQLQKRMEERRQLGNGENGEYRRQQKRNQRFSFQSK